MFFTCFPLCILLAQDLVNFWINPFLSRLNVVLVSPERSSERDYVITDSVRSMYACVGVYVYVCSMCMYVVICKIDHCIH